MLEQQDWLLMLLNFKMELSKDNLSNHIWTSYPGPSTQTKLVSPKDHIKASQAVEVHFSPLIHKKMWDRFKTKLQGFICLRRSMFIVIQPIRPLASSGLLTFQLKVLSNPIWWTGPTLQMMASTPRVIISKWNSHLLTQLWLLRLWWDGVLMFNIQISNGTPTKTMQTTFHTKENQKPKLTTTEWKKPRLILKTLFKKMNKILFHQN